MQTSRTTIFLSLLGSLVCSALVSSALYYWHGNSTPRVAYLNTEQLLNSYQAMVTARHQYQQEKQEWEHNLATLAAEARQTANSAQPVGLNKLLNNRSAAFKKQQFLDYQQAVYRQDPEEMQRLTKPVVESANRFIANYSREHHYDLVLTTAGQGDVLYADKAMDITSDVLVKLNAYLADSLAHGAPRHRP